MVGRSKYHSLVALLCFAGCGAVEKKLPGNATTTNAAATTQPDASTTLPPVYVATLVLSLGTGAGLTDTDYTVQMTTFKPVGDSDSSGTLAPTAQPAVAVGQPDADGVVKVPVEVPEGVAAAFILASGGTATTQGAYLPAGDGSEAPNVPVTKNGGNLANVVTSTAGEPGSRSFLGASVGSLLSLTDGIDPATLGADGLKAIGRELGASLAAADQKLIAAGLTPEQVTKVKADANQAIAKQDWGALILKPTGEQALAVQQAASRSYSDQASAAPNLPSTNPFQPAGLAQAMNVAKLPAGVAAILTGNVASAQVLAQVPANASAAVISQYRDLANQAAALGGVAAGQAGATFASVFGAGGALASLLAPPPPAAGQPPQLPSLSDALKQIVGSNATSAQQFSDFLATQQQQQAAAAPPPAPPPAAGSSAPSGSPAPGATPNSSTTGSAPGSTASGSTPPPLLMSLMSLCFSPDPATKQPRGHMDGQKCVVGTANAPQSLTLEQLCTLAKGTMTNALCAVPPPSA